MAEDVSKSAAQLSAVDSGALAVAAAPKIVAKPDQPVKRAGGRELEQEREKIVHIVRQLQEPVEAPRGLSTGWSVFLSILAIVGLPTLIAATYLFLIAADRYATEIRFAVRSTQHQSFDMLGALAGMPSSETVSDSYIVADYILSREMVRELERRVPLREMFSRSEADFFTRLDPFVSFESMVSYWNKRIDVFFDSTKNTITVEIQAFTPEDSAKIAAAVLEISRSLVNELSAQSRRDAVQFAAAELARAELRVRGARQEILEFRVATNDLDPAESATATLKIAADLEGERSRLLSQLASVSGYLADDAPSVQMLKSRIAALAGEVERIQNRVSVPAPDSDGATPSAGTAGQRAQPLASNLGKYQELLMNQEFAETAYTAAQGSIERARAEADRTQSYLAVYGLPTPPEEALYPYRLLDLFIVFVLSVVAWLVGALGFMTVRDHMP